MKPISLAQYKCVVTISTTQTTDKKATIVIQGGECGQEYYGVDESTPAALHFLCPRLYIQLLAG
jgi:hypothetical protein